MKQNEDGKTVRAIDVLFPKIGEIIGGSEREADYDKLMTRIQELGIPMKDMWWYPMRWCSSCVSRCPRPFLPLYLPSII